MLTNCGCRDCHRAMNELLRLFRGQKNSLNKNHLPLCHRNYVEALAG